VHLTHKGPNFADIQDEGYNETGVDEIEEQEDAYGHLHPLWETAGAETCMLSTEQV